MKKTWIAIGLLVIGILALGEWDTNRIEKEMQARPVGSYPQYPDGIPDIGVDPPPKHRRIPNIPKQYRDTDDWLTDEELLQNIEDAEVRGMGDDAATREAFKDELR